MGCCIIFETSFSHGLFLHTLTVILYIIFTLSFKNTHCTFYLLGNYSGTYISYSIGMMVYYTHIIILLVISICLLCCFEFSTYLLNSSFTIWSEPFSCFTLLVIIFLILGTYNSIWITVFSLIYSLQIICHLLSL